MDLDFSPLLDSWRFLASGLLLTILLSVAAVACSFVLGLAVGLGRLYGPAWLRVPLVFYVDTMRAVPVFVVLVWIYFAVPILTGHSFAPFWAALTGIGAATGLLAGGAGQALRVVADLPSNLLERVCVPSRVRQERNPPDGREPALPGGGTGSAVPDGGGAPAASAPSRTPR